MAKNTVKTSPLIIQHNKRLSIQNILDVGLKGRTLNLAASTKKLLDKNRQDIMKYVRDTEQPAYGFNRGFGHNVKLAVGANGAEDLQKNLILSHACGVGEYVNEEIVRMAMLLRAQSLARGHSGVRAEVVETIIEYLNHNVIPVVPRLGSVSASGDLAPLSHIALGLIGEGKAHYKGKVVPIQEALKAKRIKPLVLQAKEGLALNNGVQYSVGTNSIYYCKARVLPHPCRLRLCWAPIRLSGKISMPLGRIKVRSVLQAGSISSCKNLRLEMRTSRMISTAKFKILIICAAPRKSWVRVKSFSQEPFIRLKSKLIASPIILFC